MADALSDTTIDIIKVTISALEKGGTAVTDRMYQILFTAMLNSHIQSPNGRQALAHLVLQLSLLVDQEFGGLSFPVAGFGDGLMDPAPERPCENEVEAKAGAQLEAGDEAADLGHAEGNWDECARSAAPFWPVRLTRIAARKASASIDRVMCRYQPCQLRTS